MKIVKSSVRIIGRIKLNKEEQYRRIEYAGRTCYQSFDKIGDDSAKKFVDNMVKRGHYSVIEHSNFVVRTKIAPKNPNNQCNWLRGIFNSNFLDFVVNSGHVYIGGNYRAWIECLGINTIEELYSHFKDHTDLEIMCSNRDIPTRLIRYTVDFKTDRASTHELVRHRRHTFSQLSQRYVAYRKSIEFIDMHTDIFPFLMCISVWGYYWLCELFYKQLLRAKVRPENARVILPNATATQLIMTGSVVDWEKFIKLRCSTSAWKPVRDLANEIAEWHHYFYEEAQTAST